MSELTYEDMTCSVVELSVHILVVTANLGVLAYEDMTCSNVEVSGSDVCVEIYLASSPVIYTIYMIQIFTMYLYDPDLMNIDEHLECMYHLSLRSGRNFCNPKPNVIKFKLTYLSYKIGQS